ncbi:MAG TPA: flagellar biosynthetic protein FliO [Rhabdochlamydiaceae bacterium]|nr:flagellar biosynthetic protein FliO [Rhabdochlamydiaceae bacterium]
MQKILYYILFLALPFFSLQAAAPSASKPAPQEAPAAAPDKTTALPNAAPALPGEPAPDVEHSTASYEHAFVKMLVTLVGLIVLILLSVWMLRRIAQGRFSKSSTQKGIKILEKRPLSGKSMLYLVEVSGKKVLIAESQLEVRRLAIIEELSSEEN